MAQQAQQVQQVLKDSQGFKVPLEPTVNRAAQVPLGLKDLLVLKDQGALKALKVPPALRELVTQVLLDLKDNLVFRV